MKKIESIKGHIKDEKEGKNRRKSGFAAIKQAIFGEPDVNVDEDEPEKPKWVTDKEAISQILSTFIILLFMLHPQIVDKTLSLFNCRN